MEELNKDSMTVETVESTTSEPEVFVPIKAVDAEGKKIKLNKVERRKLRVINKLLAHEINGTKAAAMLKVTTRQVRNLKRQVLDEGIYGIIHKNHYNIFNSLKLIFFDKVLQ